MKLLCFVLTLFCCFAENLVAPQQDPFVVVKKKYVSKASTREVIGRSLAESLTNSAELVAALGAVQTTLLEKAAELLEQDSKSFFTNATVQQLQSYQQSVGTCAELLREARQKLLQQIAVVKAAH